MNKPILSSILAAAVLLAGTGQALASDRHQSYRDRGAEHHQYDRDWKRHQGHRAFERRELRHRERHLRHAYRLREARRHHWRERREFRREQRRWHRYHRRPVVVIERRNLMGPIVAGAILGAVIANNPQR